MRVPLVSADIRNWPDYSLENWAALTEKVSTVRNSVGFTDHFTAACLDILDLIADKDFSQLERRLERKLYVRALTTLWCEGNESALTGFNNAILEKLNKLKRLSKLSLLNLIQLYFKEFDLLPRYEQLASELRALLIKNLSRQESRAQRHNGNDQVLILARDADWLFSMGAVDRFTAEAINSGTELYEHAKNYGLDSYLSGRFGKVCQTRYFLQTLKGIPFGAHHSVLDELLKPEVQNIPFDDHLTIGHEAMKTLIDRCEEAPSEIWQEFLLNLAGDPRIRSGAMSYRRWWLPLGKERIEKVRAWLSKEDLRLFLSAVEEYGKETDNFDLNRMFPARKAFLEGLFELKLVKRTRLMLGRRAQYSVKRILGGEMKTSFAWLGNDLSDKAIIYLDCGDFHIIEGSHNFKIWIYFGLPHPDITSYDRESFSAGELRSKFPSYHDRNNNRLCGGFTHTPDSWQFSVLNFLRRNGIQLDEETLLTGRAKMRSDASREQNKVYPHRQNSGASDETPQPINVRKRLKELSSFKSTRASNNSAPKANDNAPSFTETEQAIFTYIAKNRHERARQISNALRLTTKEVNQILYGRLAGYVKSNSMAEWHLTSHGLSVYERIKGSEK